MAGAAGHRARATRSPLAEARRRAAGFEMSLALRPRSVLLLGGHVARAFRWRAPAFEWAPLGAGEACLFPHPSGLSRWWNDAGNAEHARQFLHGAIRRDAAA